MLGILGLLLLVAGGITYAVKSEMTTAVAGIIWAGLLLSILFIYVNFAEIKAVFSGRSVKYGFNMLVMVGIFVGILVMVGFMSIKYKARFDLTATKRYTLSEQTVKILKSLKKDVEAVAFYRSDERTRQAMEDILENYSNQSTKFKYYFIDPDRRPGMAEKHGVTSYRTTLVKSGERQEAVSFESEERITNAILKVTKSEAKVIYFLTGHGENSVADDQKSGYKAAKESIEKENFSVKELSLIDKAEVPEDASVLVVSGPQKDLLSEELTKITAFIEKGGSVIFMVDPYAAPGVVKYLGNYGFLIGNDIVVDTLSKVFGANYLVPVVTAYEKEHPITETFNLMTFFPLSRSVAVQKNPGAGIYPLAITGSGSWGETDQKALEDGKAEYNEDADLAGPVPVVSVVTVEAKAGEEKAAPEAKEGEKKPEDPAAAAASSLYGKIIVVGDSDFVNNTNINLAGNRDFFLNMVSWLAEEADLISIRKKSRGLSPVILTSEQGRLVFWFGVVIPPSLISIIGIGFFIKRRAGK